MPSGAALRCLLPWRCLLRVVAAPIDQTAVLVEADGETVLVLREGLIPEQDVDRLDRLLVVVPRQTH